MWLVATIAATVVVWLGVRVVDSEVNGEPPAAFADASPGEPSSTTAATDPPATANVPSATTTTTVTTTTLVAGGPGPAGSTPTGGDGATTTTRPANPTPATTPPTTAASQTRTANGQGGSVTVRQTATTVELVVATPNDGYTTEVDKQGPTEVRVQFTSDGHATEIRAFPGSAEPDVRESDGGGGDGGSGPG